MTEVLITDARVLLEDASTTEISDAVILQKLNETRNYVHDLQIYREDYGFDNTSMVFVIGYKYLMNLTLNDGTNTISADDYEVDAVNGLITFDSSPMATIPDAVYCTFTYHNFMQAVANCWLYLASKSRFSGRVKLADEDIPMDRSSREYCIQKYWDYCQSESFHLKR